MDTARDAVVTILNEGRVAMNADWFLQELEKRGFEVARRAPVEPPASKAEAE